MHNLMFAIALGLSAGFIHYMSKRREERERVESEHRAYENYARQKHH
jgi:hypothetical protein